MPSYDMVCENCGAEVVRFCSIAARNSQKCDECWHPLTKLISKLTVVGPTHSRPLDYTKQLGRTFDTVAARDAYFAEHHCVEKSKSDSSVRSLRDRLSESRAKHAQQSGFGSVERQQEHWKAEQKKAKERAK